jgi:hypothetical protein
MRNRRNRDRDLPQSSSPLMRDPGETPGFPCQNCGSRVQMTIAELLYKPSFTCVVCGCVYEKNATASAKALEMLQSVHVAAKQIEELKERYR